MKRAAIYARYSSELQSAASIDDQVALARRRCDDLGWRVVKVFDDREISGASLAGRHSLAELMALVRASQVDVVVTESLDRVSRDQADIAAIARDLRFAEVDLFTLADGIVTEMHVGLKGTMSALFLKDLAQKTRRGQIGRVNAGRIPGGKSYGYDVVRTFDDDKGQRIINQGEAVVVRRIFEKYTSDVSPLTIVAALNAERIPSPRGGQWNASTLIGAAKQRNGLLNNELYAGRIVCNRQR